MSLGTHGRELLETRYRELYWEVNELDLIGTKYAIWRAENARVKMASIERMLGYVPSV